MYDPQLYLNMFTIKLEEWNLLKWISKNKKVFLLVVVVIIIAGILDIKFEGVFYQLLPTSMQSFLSDLF